MPQNVYIYNPRNYVPGNVQNVEIPEGVAVIRTDAFRDRSDLQSVKIPDSVRKIGSGAFAYCKNLQSVAIPDGVTEIEPQVFCASGLKSVTMPDSITKIGDDAFCHCLGLKAVKIPDGVTEIGDDAFYASGVQSVTLPNGLTKIGKNAFNWCSELKSVTIPDSVKEIGEDAFDDCFGLRSVTLPKGITVLKNNTFRQCFVLQSVTIPDNVREIREGAFKGCTGLCSVTLPDGVTRIENQAFQECFNLQSLMFKNVNIAPFINIDGHGVNTFSVIKTMVEHRVSLNEHTINAGIEAAHRGRLAEWAREYPVFGTIRLSPAAKQADTVTKERLRKCFAAQKKTGYRVPKILDELAIATRVCGIPPERLAATFDIKYTGELLKNRIPIVPAEVCRCYCDKSVCDALIKKGKVSVMAEAIGLYNRSGRQACYRDLMSFIVSHMDTKTEDLVYAVDHAAEIPIGPETTLAQIKQHQMYTANLAEVEKIEAEYQKTVPGFSLSDCGCNIEPVSVTYNGLTARVLDLSDEKDIALAARLGQLTNCCQHLGSAGETAMMHSFLNPEAGFWVIEDRNGEVKAQAAIWKSDFDKLVFDNIEFANTDNRSTSERVDQFRGVIAAWAMESGYEDIIMGCKYNELGFEYMEPAPVPELYLTPEEIYAMQEKSDADVFFRDVDDVEEYMQTARYDPTDFVYTDANEQCVYIRKDGEVSEYLMEGYDFSLKETDLSAEYIKSPEHGGLDCDIFV